VRCPNCGYDRSGLPEHEELIRCPECGVLAAGSQPSQRGLFWRHSRKAIVCLIGSLLLLFAPMAGVPVHSIYASALVAMIGLVCGLYDALEAWGMLNGRLGFKVTADVASRRAISLALSANFAALAVLPLVLVVVLVVCLMLD